MNNADFIEAGYRGNEEEFLQALLREHRTNQASFVRNMIALLRGYGAHATHDLRNEAAVDACKAISEHPIPFI